MTHGTKDHPMVGKRVELHPGTDAWMMGDRYGEIVRFQENPTHGPMVKVLLDKSKRKLWLTLDRVTEV